MSYCTNKTTKVPELCKKSCGLCPGDEPVTEESRVLATTTTTTTLQPTTTSAVTVAPEVTVPECKQTFIFFSHYLIFQFLYMLTQPSSSKSPTHAMATSLKILLPKH
jgi:hypothetical protein